MTDPNTLRSIWQDDEGRALREALREGLDEVQPSLHWSAIQARAADRAHDGVKGLAVGRGGLAVVLRPVWAWAIAAICAGGALIWWQARPSQEAAITWRGQAQPRLAAQPVEAAAALVQQLRALGFDAQQAGEGKCQSVRAHGGNLEAHQQALFALELAPDADGRLHVMFCPP